MEDYIPVYPDVHDPEIQQKITAKKEFDELRTDLREELPPPGEFFKHQKFVQRYMRNYNVLMSIQETGTGKTCSAVAMIELARADDNIRHAYILTPGRPTGEDFKRQLACTCTRDVYITQAIKNSTAKNKTRLVSREISKFYTVTTYRMFAMSLRDMNDEERLAKYSRCAFFIDEIDKIEPVNPRDIEKRLVEVAEAKEFNRQLERGEVSGRKKKVRSEMVDVYGILSSFFGIMRSCKILGATATPMSNDVNEIAKTFNVILPNNEKMPTNIDYATASFEFVEKYFRGRVVYIRADDTGALRVDEGSPLLGEDLTEYSHSVIVPESGAAPMEFKDSGDIAGVPALGVLGRSQEQIAQTPGSTTITIPTQTKTFISNMVAGGVQDRVFNEESLKKVSAVYANLRQASAFVFPDGSYGGKTTRITTSVEEFNRRVAEGSLRITGLGKYVTYTKSGGYKTSKKLKSLLADRETLREMSTKFATVLDIEDAVEGCSYVYTDFVEGGGAILFGETLKANGWTQFDEVTPVFISNRSGMNSFCTSDTGERMIRPGFEKKLRYAVIQGTDTTNAKLNNIMALLNSKENMFGEYLRLVIVSPTGKVGINLFNIRKVHIMNAGWHEADITQEINRGFRVVSHRNLLEYYQSVDPTIKHIDVRVYKHTAYSSEGKSVDATMYRIAEDKNIHIARMMRYLKMSSIDCQVNYRRNIRTKTVHPEGGIIYDEDYSQTCDYQLCDYKCVSPSPKEIDYSTYDILYYQDEVDKIKKAITENVSVSGTVTYDELVDLWVKTGIHREKMIQIAISDLSKMSNPFLDRFGHTTYIRNDGFTIYSQRDDGLTGVATSRYSNTVTVIQPGDFSELVSSMMGGTQTNIINHIRSLDPVTQDAQIHVFIEELSLPYRATLLEIALTNEVTGKAQPIDKYIINKWKYFIFHSPEPSENIRLAYAALETGKKIPYNKFTKPDSIPGVPDVLFHTLYSSKVDRVSYNITAATSKVKGTIRVYNAEENKWRDANRYETPAYKWIADSKIDENTKSFEQQEVYGSILDDGKFRIHGRPGVRQTDAKTKRDRHRGSKCINMKKNTLIDILWHLETKVPDVESIVAPEYNVMIHQLSGGDGRKRGVYNKNVDVLKSLPLDRLTYIWKWLNSKLTTKNYCDYIRDSLNAKGLIYNRYGDVS